MRQKSGLSTCAKWFDKLRAHHFSLKCHGRTVVVAQLAELLLPTPNDPGSNPAIINFKEHLVTVNFWKDEKTK